MLLALYPALGEAATGVLARTFAIEGTSDSTVTIQRLRLYNTITTTYTLANRITTDPETNE